MDARQADLLRKIDPVELGQRLRAARVAKAMTQTDLAGADVSVGYVSRIEAGQRRPNLQVLTDLCLRLGTPVEQLLMGVAPQELEQIKLNLDFAELVARVGSGPDAPRRQAREALEQAAAGFPQGAGLPRTLPDRPCPRGPGHASTTRSSSSRPCSRRGSATSCRSRSASRSAAATASPVTTRKAVEVGEMILDQLADTPLDSTDEAVQMAVTLAAAYFERGDTGQAVRVCRKASHQGREARLADGPGLRLLERQHHRGRAGRGPRRDPAGRARACAVGRGSRRPQPRTAAHSSWAPCSCAWTRP